MLGVFQELNKLVYSAGTLLSGKDFVACGPPACPDRFNKFLRKTFGGHLGGEAFVIVVQSDEIYSERTGARVIGRPREFRRSSGGIC